MEGGEGDWAFIIPPVSITNPFTQCKFAAFCQEPTSTSLLTSLGTKVLLLVLVTLATLVDSHKQCYTFVNIFYICIGVFHLFLFNLQ